MLVNRQLFTVTALRFIIILVYYLSSLALAKFLDPKNFDISVFILNIVFFSSILIRSGLDPSVPWLYNSFQDIKKKIKPYNKLIFTCNIIFAFMLGLILLYISQKYKLKLLVVIFLYIGIFFSSYLYSAANFYGEIFKSLGFFDQFLLRFQLIFSLTGVFVSLIYFFFLDKSEFIFFFIIFINLILIISIFLLFNFLINNKNIKKKLNIPHNSSTALQYFFSQINNSFFSNIPVIFIFFLDAEVGQTGFFFLTLKFAEVISYPLSIVGPIYYKDFYNDIINQNYHKLNVNYKKSILINTSLSLFLFIIISLWIYYFSEFFFKTNFFIANFKLTMILFLSYFLISICGPIGQLFLISGNSKYLNYVSSFTNIISIIIGWFLYYNLELSILNVLIYCISLGILFNKFLLFIIYFKLISNKSLFL